MRVWAPALAVTMLALVGCRNYEPITVNRLVPAEITLPNVDTIACHAFEEPPALMQPGIGGQLADELLPKLTEGGIFKIVDRQSLGKVIDELEMQSTDYFDPQKAVQVGKQLGADALILGKVAEYRVASEITPAQVIKTHTEEMQDPNTGKVYMEEVEEPPVETMRHTKQGILRASFRVVLVETGQVLTGKTVASKTPVFERYDDPDPSKDTAQPNPFPTQPLPPDEELKGIVVEETVREIASHIVPHYEPYEYRWEFASGLDDIAASLFKQGLSEKAEKELLSQIELAAGNPEVSPETVAALYYDLALVQETMGKMDDAIANFNSALDQHHSDLHMRGLRDAEKHKEEMLKLAEQQGR